MGRDLSRYNIIGSSRPMRELAEWVYTAAPLWDTIIITGERGTGKELLSRAIHRLGPTKGAEPVIVDCASLHPATVESVLFGHERGSFTGAVHRHVGFLESAHNGTIFLDEIGLLPLELQGRFLRFLEEKTLTRIGASKAIHVRARIIAATNRRLETEAKQGRFLPDLRDRLSVLPIATPPLREREDDLFLLAAHFLETEPRERFTQDALEFLKTYPFPGNVRELRNLCRRVSVFCRSEKISRDDLTRYLDYDGEREES